MAVVADGTERALVKVLDRTPAQKAIQTDKMTDTLLTVFAGKHADRWKFVSFRGPNGRDATGIVDTVAIRKNTSKPKAVRSGRRTYLN